MSELPAFQRKKPDDSAQKKGGSKNFINKIVIKINKEKQIEDLKKKLELDTERHQTNFQHH